MSSLWVYLSVSVLMLTGLLLIFIVLLQRGRGGGLAGAFGGAGGQSALGTKAGDVFTKITVGLAAIWVCVACLSIYAMRYATYSRIDLPDTVESAAPAPEVAGGGTGNGGLPGDPALLTDPSGTDTKPAEKTGGEAGTTPPAKTTPAGDESP